MKKLISAVFAFAIAAGVMAGMTVASADEVTEISTAAELVTALGAGGSYKIVPADGTLNCAGVNLKITAANVEIDLNNNVVTTKGDGFCFNSTDGTQVNATIKNGTITNTGNYALQIKGTTASTFTLSNVTANAKQPVLVQNAAHTVNIDDSTLTGGTANGGLIHITYGNCIVSDSTLEYSTASGVLLDATAANQASITADNVTVTPTGGAGNAFTVNNGKYGSIDIDGGTYTGYAYGIFYKGYEHVNVSNATIGVGAETGTYGMTVEIPEATVGAGATVNNTTINGGRTGATYVKNAAFAIGGNSVVTGGVNIGGGGSYVITGGTYTANPTSYVDTENYDVTDNGNGTYTVTAKSAAATVTGYYTFEKTDNEAQSYSTVKITVLENEETKQGTASLPTVVELSQGATFGLTIEGIPADVTITGITLE